jgi:hypothetical protein
MATTPITTASEAIAACARIAAELEAFAVPGIGKNDRMHAIDAVLYLGRVIEKRETARV